MANYSIQFPDGKVRTIEGPDDASPDQLRQAALRAWDLVRRPNVQWGPSPEESNPAYGRTNLQFGPIDTGIEVPGAAGRMLTGAGQMMMNRYRGAQQLLGLGGPELQSTIDEQARLDRPLNENAAAGVGRVAGDVAMTLPLGGAAKTFMGATGLGALSGATEALTSEQEGQRRGRALVGAITGGGLQQGAHIASKMINPNLHPEMREALRQGMRPTAANLVDSNPVSFGEYFARQVPGVGVPVIEAEKDAIESFNRVTLNRVLGLIGKPVKKIDDLPVGTEGVNLVSQKVQNAYDEILGRIGKVDVDRTALNNIYDIVSRASSQLPRASARRLQEIVGHELRAGLPRVGQRGGRLAIRPISGMSADDLKGIDSRIGHKARQFGRGANAEDPDIAAALREVRNELWEGVKRSHPKERDALKAADLARARLARIEKAAAKATQSNTDDPGVFTPKELLAATASMESGRDGSRMGRGLALDQGFAEAAQKLIQRPGKRTPNLLSALAAVGAVTYQPLIAAMPAVSTLMNTSRGRWLLNKIAAQEPTFLRQLSAGLVNKSGEAAIAPGSREANVLLEEWLNGRQ